MDQIIFLHDDEEARAVLSQVQQSTAQRLILVVAPHLERLRLSMLLRLIRRHAAERTQQLGVVSEDRLVRTLAERMGCSIAATLDEYHELAPGRRPSLTKRPRRPWGSAIPLARHQSRVLAAPETIRQGSVGGGTISPQHNRLPSSERLQPAGESRERHQDQQPSSGRADQPVQGTKGKPGANLDAILVDGYLPNPGAMPGLDEEAEQTEQEEARRFHYEIVDENHPSQAQREAEAHEAKIIARIRKTSAPAPTKEPHPTSSQLSKESANDPDAVPSPMLENSLSGSHEESSTLPESGATQSPGGRLRPMRTLDDLLHDRGRTSLFEWFVQHTTTQGSEKTEGSHKTPSRTASRSIIVSVERSAPKSSPSGVSLSAPATVPGRMSRLLGGRTLSPHKAATHPAPRRRFTPRRVAIALSLALSLSMTCLGLSMLPSAQVSYQEKREPYSETIPLVAQAATPSQPTTVHTSPSLPAEIAHFDGILTVQAIATGQQENNTTAHQRLAVPMQSDADQVARLLDMRLQSLGQQTLNAQTHPGDLLGPAWVEEQIATFPTIGTPLPDGSTTFQVSLALHMRAALVRKLAWQQAASNKLKQDINQRRHGFLPVPGQRLDLQIVNSEPDGAGEAMLELHLLVQASGIIGPALTPEEARSAIAGLSVEDARAYLLRQPGITDVSIAVLPKWLNRLPIFSVRIRINLES